MGGCEFCLRPGVQRAGKEDGLEKPAFVCENCWKLLKDPRTALPLIRGNVSMNLRGTMPEKQLAEMANKFLDEIRTWKARN